MNIETLRILVRRNVQKGRETTVIYALLLFNIGFLTALSLWWALLAIPALLVVWIFSGMAAGAGIQLGNLTLPSEVFNEIDNQNRTLIKIVGFFTNVRDKFRKDNSNGSDSSDDVHAEQ